MAYNLLNQPSADTGASSTAPLTFEAYVKDSTSGPRLGAVIGAPAPISVKIAARAGFHWLMIDMEHSPLSPEQATELAHATMAASQGHCKPIIRVPSHSVEYIKWALDSGASGVIIPMVDTAEQVEAIINKALYPPRGSRSYGPFNAPFGQLDPSANLASYVEMAQNREIAILPMIESKEGIENTEAIMQVDGVTGVMIGPYDMRFSLGLPGGDGDEPEFVDALDKICAIAKKLDKVVGSMGASEEVARKRTAQGFGFLLASIDFTALSDGYRMHIETARRGISDAKKF